MYAGSSVFLGANASHMVGGSTLLPHCGVGGLNNGRDEEWDLVAAPAASNPISVAAHHADGSSGDGDAGDASCKLSMHIAWDPRCSRVGMLSLKIASRVVWSCIVVW